MVGTGQQTTIFNHHLEEVKSMSKPSKKWRERHAKHHQKRMQARQIRLWQEQAQQQEWLKQHRRQRQKLIAVSVIIALITIMYGLYTCGVLEWVLLILLNVFNLILAIGAAADRETYYW